MIIREMNGQQWVIVASRYTDTDDKTNEMVKILDGNTFSSTEQNIVL